MIDAPLFPSGRSLRQCQCTLVHTSVAGEPGEASAHRDHDLGRLARTQRAAKRGAQLVRLECPNGRSGEPVRVLDIERSRGKKGILCGHPRLESDQVLRDSGVEPALRAGRTRVAREQQQRAAVAQPRLARIVDRGFVRRTRLNGRRVRRRPLAPRPCGIAHGLQRVLVRQVPVHAPLEAGDAPRRGDEEETKRIHGAPTRARAARRGLVTQGVAGRGGRGDPLRGPQHLRNVL
mmetsp:Transcript_13937/g.58175  ORF Transcript_13937/g.58175 Transcript_13937/m.58175 type:complete len:234 (+) Transcript_13937:1350-2051(+)